jgi:hypothetical protein
MPMMPTLRLVLAIAAVGFAARSSAAPTPAAKTFATPLAAAEALVAAAAAQDVPALVALFGSDGKRLVESGDAVHDRNDREKFAELARQKLELVNDPTDAHQMRLLVGPGAWPFPVALVQKNGKWSFATKKGVREVLARRIGANELDAIEICHGYVEAQKEYAAEDRDGSGVRQYAQRVISSGDKHDGLVWRNADGSLGGPIAENIAAVIAEGYTDKRQPYHGYNFRILKKQGPCAPLGAMDYVIGGKMIGGFALVAWPAQYGISGVKTFMVSHEDIVYEKDLGPETSKKVSRLDRFDPDATWHVVP